MKKIVAIGGGEIGRPGYPIETEKIDREIIRLTGKKHPKALLLPTASKDSLVYWETFQKYYGKKLGCRTEVLFLIREKPNKKEIAKKILGADLIYVGGGNTLMMMRVWRRIGVDKLLKKAWQKGTVMSGLSAGSLCWHKAGHSDSMSFYSPKHWHYIRVKCLGFVNAINCPHFGSERRQGHFKKFMKKYPEVGIGIDSKCAVIYLDDKYKIIDSKKNANAYKIYRKKGKVIVEALKKYELRPLKELLRK